MKRTSIFLVPLISFAAFTTSAQSSSIAGTWQLVRQGTCLEEIASVEPDSVAGLRDDMHSRSDETAQIVTFRENSTGEESTRILSKSKTLNAKKFLYKFNGEMLLILDKKSQTISDSYLIDKFTRDSLIISNATRPCETRIFVKITPRGAN
jgi:hypothetical protein